jgi:hypothetical protein
MPGCAGAPAARNPAAPARRRPAPRRVFGRQLGDDLPGYLQPFQFVLGVGELLVQELDLAGQLADPAVDPFRQLDPALQGIYCANRDEHRR